jgi:O-antigen/teichoic acid export membrane protein
MRLSYDGKGMKKNYSSYLTLASSAALAQGFLLLISPLVTRLYGPEDVGGFGIILGLGALIGSVGTGRLEHAIPVADSSLHAIRIALLGMLMALIISSISAVIFVMLPALGFMGGGWQEVPLLAISAISFSLAFFQLVNALLLRQQAYGSVGQNKIYQGGMTGILQLLLGFSGLGASGLIWAQALGYLAGGMRGLREVLMNGCVVLRMNGVQLRATFVYYQRFPLILAPAALFNQAAQHFPVLALGYVYGLYEAGLYALVMRICGAPLGLLGQSVSQVYASEFRAHLNDTDEGLARKYMIMLGRLLGIGVVVVGFIVLILNVWGTWLFGEEWANIGTVSLLLLLMLLVDFATTPVSMTLSYLNRASIQLWWDIGRLLAIIGVFVMADYFVLRFGQLLVLLAGVWSISLLVHVWLTYRTCRFQADAVAVPT